MIVRMMLYGLLFGGLAGASVFFAARYYYPVPYHTLDELLEILQFLWYLILIGTVWGGIAGLFSGIGLFQTSKTYMNHPYRIRTYLENTVVLTAIISSFFFIPALFVALFLEWTGLLLFAVWVLIAVCCSYRAITLFLRESDVRKRKVQ